MPWRSVCNSHRDKLRVDVPWVAHHRHRAERSSCTQGVESVGGVVGERTRIVLAAVGDVSVYDVLNLNLLVVAAAEGMLHSCGVRVYPVAVGGLILRNSRGASRPRLSNCVGQSC